MHGMKVVVIGGTGHIGSYLCPQPVEDERKEPFGDYGIRKMSIEKYLLQQFFTNEFPATILHPGRLVGPGWNPVNPAGNFNPQVFTEIASGREILLPNLGVAGCG